MSNPVGFDLSRDGSKSYIEEEAHDHFTSGTIVRLELKQIYQTLTRSLEKSERKLADFVYRAEHGFTPLTPEPSEGWLGQIDQTGCLASDIISLGKSLESAANVPPPISPQTWTDSKQRRS